MLTRKQFLSRMLALSTGVYLPGLYNFACSTKNGKQANQEQILTFDLHSHPGRFNWKGIEGYGGDEGVLKTVTEMNNGGLSGGFISMVSDMLVLQRTENGIIPAKHFEPGEAWKDIQRQVAVIKELLPSLDARLGLNADDLSSETGPVALFLACEGGDFIETNIEKVDLIFADGVRSIQLVHYAPNDLGDLQTHQPVHGGLSETGKSVVKRMNELGMVIDVAHASFETVKDVAELTEFPLILSHSILKMEADRPISARAISPEHAKVVAETGGVIGAWPSGFNLDFDEYIDNILRLAEVVGIDHVGLGTDMDSNFRPVMDSYRQLPDWLAALRSRGLSADEVKKLAGENALRVIKAVIKDKIGVP